MILFLINHCLKIRVMLVGFACPVEVYASTDEEEGPYSVTQTVESQVITEMLEIHYQSTKAFGN
jgi:hypothetical protein